MGVGSDAASPQCGSTLRVEIHDAERRATLPVDDSPHRAELRLAALHHIAVHDQREHQHNAQQERSQQIEVGDPLQIQ